MQHADWSHVKSTHTGWEVDWRRCDKHGETLHVSYVLDAQGNKIETFEGDTRKPEEVGKVVYECVDCQVLRWDATGKKI